MGILNTRKNKRYSYQPRYYNGEGSPFELKHKFDDYRVTAGSNKGLKTKFNNAISDYKSNNDTTGANRRVLYIIAALILVFLFIIDFDLSIFSFKR
ncbi:riboflavin synthase subunit beta [Psychroserpens algicola]|uniref:Riboflavin synthase subunit beta n=1 Tax=Psychroserpens algicola TaxID=1719034 RepID=A0ABT0HC33_9FLAO|nr:riboflavin synthase subunit beta [Psychroserpens algicola]MCK8481450.1 riboflavin synthase subunit beta [Psychroserpens algicola]